MTAPSSPACTSARLTAAPCRARRSRAPARARQPRASRVPFAAAASAAPAATRGLDGGEYSRELEVALDAVRLASTVCQEVQGQLMRMDEQAETKDDRSLVTLADYAAQAIIAWYVSTRSNGSMCVKRMRANSRVPCVDRVREMRD
jgi:3'(2'), 5'-bisphosphate nucleotidase